MSASTRAGGAPRQKCGPWPKTGVLVCAAGRTAPDVMDVFFALDTDGDGMISHQEFIRAAREFCYSTDPDAPGGILFGHPS